MYDILQSDHLVVNFVIKIGVKRIRVPNGTVYNSKKSPRHKTIVKQC